MEQEQSPSTKKQEWKKVSGSFLDSHVFNSKSETNTVINRQPTSIMTESRLRRTRYRPGNVFTNLSADWNPYFSIHSQWFSVRWMPPTPSITERTHSGTRNANRSDRLNDSRCDSYERSWSGVHVSMDLYIKSRTKESRSRSVFSRHAYRKRYKYVKQIGDRQVST